MMLLRVMTLVQRAAVPLLALGLLGLGRNGDVTSTGSFEPTTGPRVAATLAAPPDTLRTSAERGTPLILTLPSELNGQSVERYSLLRGPALSGVAGRSFTWIPEGAEPGTHEALLRAHLPDTPGDTLVIRIDLSS
jgi:hypothetical protein